MPTTREAIDVESGKTKRSEELILLKDVLKNNGEENLYDQVMELAKGAEEDPPVIFGWENVELFIHAVEAALEAQQGDQEQPKLPPPPFALPEDKDVDEFKVALLNYIRIPTAEAPVGTSVLPCSLLEYAQSVGRLVELRLDPWIQRIIAIGGPEILPIATIYVPRPGSNTVDNAMENRPNSLWG